MGSTSFKYVLLILTLVGFYQMSQTSKLRSTPVIKSETAKVDSAIQDMLEFQNQLYEQLNKHNSHISTTTVVPDIVPVLANITSVIKYKSERYQPNQGDSLFIPPTPSNKQSKMEKIQQINQRLSKDNQPSKEGSHQITSSSFIPPKEEKIREFNQPLVRNHLNKVDIVISNKQERYILGDASAVPTLLDLIVFTHVPKTGGGSFYNTLRWLTAKGKNKPK